MFYTVDENADVPIMLLDTHIGMDSEDGMGIDGSLFQRELLQLDNLGKKSIEIWINSPGGSVYEGYKIFNAILNTKTPVDTYNVGMAASMAGVIFMAGRRRRAADYALFMTHFPFGSDNDKMLSAMADSLVIMTCAKSGIPEDQMRKMMKVETWMSAEECYSQGICTEPPVSTSVANKKWMPAASGDNKVIWMAAKKVAANLITPNNSHKTTTNMSEYNKVAAKLNLNSQASADAMVEAIDAINQAKFTAESKLISINDTHRANVLEIQNKHQAAIDAEVRKVQEAEAKANDAAAKLTAAETALAAEKTALAAKTKEYDDIKAKYDAMEQAKADAELAAKRTASETMVRGYVVTGRIKDDEKIVAKWVEMGVNDLEGTKAMIEAIPLSVKAPYFQTQVPAAAGAAGGTDVTAALGGTSAMSLAIKNKLRREGKLTIA